MEKITFLKQEDWTFLYLGKIEWQPETYEQQKENIVAIEINAEDFEKIQKYKCEATYINDVFEIKDSEYFLNRNIIEYNKSIDILNIQFEKKVADFLLGYSPSEIATFETKRIEAEKFLNTGQSIYIETLANAKGMLAVDLANIIQKKSMEFMQAYCQLEAWKDSQVREMKIKYNIL